MQLTSRVNIENNSFLDDIFLDIRYIYLSLYCCLRLIHPFQMFKNSIILQGIAARNAQGNASSDQAEYVGSLAPHLDSLSAQLLREFVARSSKL
jgi:hypothetical protein